MKAIAWIVAVTAVVAGSTAAIARTLFEPRNIAAGVVRKVEASAIRATSADADAEAEAEAEADLEPPTSPPWLPPAVLFPTAGDAAATRNAPIQEAQPRAARTVRAARPVPRNGFIDIQQPVPEAPGTVVVKRKQAP